MIYTTIIISFLLEGAFSNITYNTILMPLFSLVSLVILYPFFKNNKIKFIITCGVVGMFYDIVFTNSLFINTFSFILCSLIIILIKSYINNKTFSISLLNLLIIIIYKIISYFLLCTFEYIAFEKNVFLSGIYSSILLNLIYGIILYFICEKVSKRLNVRKYE